MVNISLRPYQREAVEFALNVKKCIHLISTGLGKTICAISLMNLLFKKDLIDKVIVACTVSAVSPFTKDLSRKAGYEVALIETVEDFKKFLESKTKVVLIKHSLIDILGSYQEHIDWLEDSLTKNYKRILLIVDEAHELNNHESLGHQAFQRISFAFERILLLTATPWSTHILQLWGLISLVHPKFWPLKDFKETCIVEKPVKDWQTGKWLRNELVEFKNIGLIREKIKPFTFTYFPTIDLVFIKHLVKLRCYKAFDLICSGETTSLTGETLEEVVEEEEKEIKKESKVSANLQKALKIVGKALKENKGKKNTKENFGIRLPLMQAYLDDSEEKQQEFLRVLREELCETTKVPIIEKGVIVYARRVETIKNLSKLVSDLGIENKTITGSTSYKKRSETEDWFQDNPYNRIVFISDAGGASLNLNSTDELILYSTPASVKKFKQVIGRVARGFGKFTRYYIRSIMVSGTLDEYSLEMLGSKASIESELLSCDSIPVTKTSKFEEKKIKLIKKALLWRNQLGNKEN